MHLFFQIQNLQLLMFCMDDQKFSANLNYFSLRFLLQHHYNNSFLHFIVILLHLISSFLHTRFLLVPHAYSSLESIDCFLLSSLIVNAILLTFSINTLCFSLLNHCCDFSINLLFFINFFIMFSEKFCMRFIFL